MMLMPQSLGWWYWLFSAVLLTLGMFIDVSYFQILIGLSLIHLIHFVSREKSITHFPVQIRIGYLFLMVLFYVEPLRLLYWIPLVGTWAIVLTGYCFLARVLSLMPWNRKDALSLSLMKRTLFSAPVRGNILQGLPPEKS